MKQPQPPGAAQPFSSLDMDPEEFRSLGYAVIDSIAAYYSTIRDRRIIPESTSGHIEQLFCEPLPQAGQSPESLLQDWHERVLPHATHLGSPRYFGFVNGSGTMMSVFAEALAASVNMNAGGWKAGPSATEIERRSIAWIAELIGYPTDCGGLLVGGGTLANFSALLTALRNTAPYDTTREGLQCGQRRGRHLLYMSDHEGHISIVKAADMLNLGRDAIRRVPSGDDLRMDTAALERMIEEDQAAGDLPFCVVAQVGSINIGVVDPLEEIARICREKGLWFHADGACGAVGAMLPELAHLYRGLERADSVTLDPHKWLFISYECGCLLVREPERLRRTFSISAPYLQGSLPTDYKGLDYFEYGPQMSRGFDALKLWMTLKHWGREGYQQLLRQNIQCAQHLHQLVSASPDFEPLHKPELFIYSFRYLPRELKPLAAQAHIHAYLDKLNQKICDTLTATGFAFILSSRVKGQVVIRLSICSHRTTLADIEAVFEQLAHLGLEMHAQEGVALSDEDAR
jgi:aromatic-L-amino-acid/L-tryptophan decarboxylase